MAHGPSGCDELAFPELFAVLCVQGDDVKSFLSRSATRSKEDFISHGNGAGKTASGKRGLPGDAFLFVEFGYEFDTDKACDPNAKTEHFVTYEYTDPTTSCVNRDSVSITLNPLPRLQLTDGYFCQDKGTVDLGEITVLPARLTGPSRTVNCLDCGSYNEADIIKFTKQQPTST